MKRKSAVLIPVFAAATVGIMQLGAQTRSGREDCVRYDPSTLTLTEERAGWQLSRDDGARFMVLDTKEDADAMLAVFRAHSQLCYVGRDNKRPNRARYVHYYWK